MASFLTNPWLLLASLVVGAYLGLDRPEIASALYPVADLYVELLKMVLLPFMISAIVISLSRLVSSHSFARRVGPIVTVFVLSSLLIAVLGVATAVVTSPGANISDSSRQTLGQLINRSPYAVDLEIALDDPTFHVRTGTGDSVISQLIPDNIFQALSVGDNLKILFFAIAFGIGLGSLYRKDSSDGLLSALVNVYDICTRIITWVNLLLPLALCAMVAKQFATVGAGQLLAMVKFTIGFVAASLLTWIISILVIWLSSGARFGQTLAAARQPVMVAIATRSSIACIPTSISALVDALGYDRTRIELMIPLGVTLLRFGPTLYYAFSTVFVTQLYDTPTSLLLYATIVVGSLLTGLASAGTTGVLTISLLGLIFQPLNLPLEAALALLITIDPVIDIFRTVTIVLPNCAVAAFLYRDERGAAHADPLSVEDATHDAIGLPTAAPEPAE